MHPSSFGRSAIRHFVLSSTMVFMGCGGTSDLAPAPTPIPVIADFAAAPATIGVGDSSVLSWSVSGANSVSLDHGIGTVTGNTTTLSPAATTTYTLTATNGAGNATKTAIVTVGPKGAYFGLTIPGETPVLFAPTIMTSVSAFAAAPAFSPDGTQCFVSVGAADYSSATLYYSVCVNNVWKPFVKAPFLSSFTFSNEPVFSADGKTLTFTGDQATGNLDLWNVNFTTDQGWGTPLRLPVPINGGAADGRGSYMTDGTMYFTSTRDLPGGQIYEAHKDTSQAWLVEKLGPPINMNFIEGDPCIAPDGHFLIFYSGRGGINAKCDLFVSFSDGQGGWGTPINLGAAFNTANDEVGAHLSADGQYLFFTRHTSQGNGTYWVATSAIEKLKP